MEASKPVALIYCRVSTKGQEENGTSLESQESACVAHSAQNGYTVGRVTREVYTGSELWDRPQLSRDRAELKSGRFQALICYSTDRLSRDPIHLAIIAEECARLSVALLFVSETFDNSDEGDLIRYVKGFSDKKERAKIRERSLRGKYTRALQGKIHNMGTELYGYRRDKAAGVRRIHEPEAIVVRRIFALVAQEHRAYYNVAQILNEENIAPPGAARVAAKNPERRVYWAAGTVMRVVRNPTYKGEAVAWRWQKQKTSSGSYAPVHRPESEHIALPAGVVPPIVSPEVWQQAHDAVQAQSGDRTRNEKTPYLLRGLIYCAVCNRKLWPSWRRNGGDPTKPKIRTYRCASHGAPGPICKGRVVNAERAEVAVWHKVREILEHPESIAAELTRRQEAGPDATLTGDLATAQRELVKCEKAQARLIQRFTAAEDDTFPWELVEREVKRLEAEKARWQQTVCELQGRIEAQQVAVTQLEDLYTYCAKVSAGLEASTFEEKRDVLDALDIRLVADGKEGRIFGEIAFTPEDDAVSLTSGGYYMERRPSTPIAFDFPLCWQHTV